MAKQVFEKDATLKALTKKPAAPGERKIVYDAVLPKLAVRVTEKGTRTFVLLTRFPGKKHPEYRALGKYGELTLEAARTKARHWIELIGKGIDPAIEEERRRQEEVKKQANTFAAVFADFVAEKLPGERKGKEVERDIKKEFLPTWGARPITDITDLDVLAVIRAKKRTAPAQARNLLGYASRIFQWAVDQRVYGIRASPCIGLKPAKIIGDKTTGDRTLSDDELFALWRAADRSPYPYGPAYKVLLLTALRLNEAADARRSELDEAKRIWVIPAARMKAKESKARPHAVPLTDDLSTIFKSLPKFKRGDHLFSTTFGESPAWMSDKIKKRIDARILRTLRALARKRGDDPSSVTLPAWKNHDIRRTVRSQLSRLKISEEAREAVLAHARPGIKKNYDHHDYLDEKREALELWAARLRSIVDPPPSNVVPMPKRA